jgi:ectoine hydroxylase-related dioxygenase (phytanoyl-CoA dioxygenase family)
MATLKSFFLDENMYKLFDENGFVIIPFFNDFEIDKLKSIYGKTPKKNMVFESSSYIEDDFLSEKINNNVSEVFQPVINAVFSECKPLGTSFLTKKSGEDSVMPIHQDWSVVDEAIYSSITCWIPLQDTNANNGAMRVIPGSHKFTSELRSPTIPVCFEDIQNDLEPFLKTLPLKAGEALIFNQSLWHASHVNISGKDRVAVTFGLTDVDAKLYMYYYKNGIVEKWSMPNDMFLKYSKIKANPTIGSKIATFPYTVSKIKLSDVSEKAMNHRKNITMKPLFKDKMNQDFFQKNGFIKLPALNSDDIELLKEFYAKLGLHDEIGYGFHVGMDNHNKDLVLEMVQEIKSVALPKVQPFLVDTQLFTASFVVKEPNPQGVVPPHQDWSFVDDEESYCSVTCWIPLQDVNMENGCIGLIRGSHNFFDTFRASPSPQVDTPLKEHMYTIFPFLELIEMKAGEALFFNNKTIHASPPNNTSYSRLAVGLGFTQADAKICHYYLKPGSENKVLKYNINPDFFFKYDNAQLSKMYDEGKLIQGYGEPEEVEFNFEKLTAEEFTKRMQDAGNTFNAPLVSVMTKLFSNNQNATSNDNTENHVEKTTQENNIIEPINKLPFWKIYTPLNVVREIKHRLTN